MAYERWYPVLVDDQGIEVFVSVARFASEEAARVAGEDALRLFPTAAYVSVRQSMEVSKK